MVIVPLMAAIGTLVGSGLVLVAGSLGVVPLLVARRRPNPGDEPTESTSRRSSVGTLRRRRDLALAGIAGLVALVVTRWPVAVPLAMLAVLGSRGVAGGATRSTIERLDAIAAWTEMLRDTLAGASGLTQALVATAGTAPKPVGAEIRALAGKLTAGVPIEDALRELADEIADPAADMVVASLVMASRERAQRLGDLLGALAQAIREEVAMRLGIESSRAASQTAVRMITGFSLGLFGLMCVFARAYLAPYESASGQVMLGVVGLVFALGLWLMSVMVRPRPFARLLLSEAGGRP